MAPQLPLNLNEPLSKHTKATLEQISLVPELATSGLTLQGDYYRQSQAKFNRHLITHPISVTFIVIVTSVFGYFQLSDALSESSDFWSFVTHRDTLSRVMMTFPALLFGLGCVGIFSHLMADDFKTISDSLELPSYSTSIFGFDLKKFANLPMDKKDTKDKALFEQGEKSSVIMYRESPIAIATVVPLEEESDKSNFVVKISGFHVRKAFAKVDFDQMLLEWALSKSKELASSNRKYEKDATITILADAYSFDAERIKLLRANFFEKVLATTVLNPFTSVIEAEKELEDIGKKKNINSTGLFGSKTESLNGLFNAYRVTYSLTVHSKLSIEEIK